MDLDRRGREYVTWPISGAAEDLTFEVTFDDTTWAAMERPDASTLRVLVAGPDATSNPDGTVVLDFGFNQAAVRAIDNPEIVIRHAGTITVK